MSTALAALLLAAAFLVPEHYLPWDTYRSQALAATALLVAATGALLHKRPAGLPARWAWPWIAAVPVLLAPLPWLQWWGGHISFLSDALLPSLYLLALALAIATGRRWAALDADALLRALVLGLVMAGVLSALIAAMQWLRITTPAFVIDVRPGSRPGANLGQPNHMATLLVLGVCCTLLCFERRWLGGAVCSLLAAVLGFGLACSMSRGAGLATCGLVLVALASGPRLGLRVTRSALLAWLAGVLVLAISWDLLGQALGMDSAMLEERATAGTRLTHWAVMLDAVRLSPWLGHGWNQVAMAQQLTAHLHPVTGELLQNSHNALLDLWVWIGIPAGTLVGAAVAWWFFGHWARARSATSTCLLAAITAVFVHAMLEYPLDHAYFLLPLGLMMGLLDGLSPQPARAFSSPAAVPAAAVLGGAAMLAWVSMEYLEVETRFRDARVGLLGFNNRVDIVPPPPVLLLDGPREYHRLMVTPASGAMQPAQLAWMQRVAQRYPFPPALLRHALAAALNGQPDAAARALRGLCAVHLAARCDEGREGWAAAQRTHPALADVPFPQTRNMSRPLTPGPKGATLGREPNEP